VDGLFMAFTGPCKHYGAEKTWEWRTDPDVLNGQNRRIDGICDKCCTHWRKTKKRKLGEDSFRRWKRVNFRVKNGHRNRDLNQT
jgi:hypothetical protein